MASKTVTVASASGLHTRPATRIAEVVTELGVPVTLSIPGGSPVDAGSALMIMTLGAGKDAKVVVESPEQSAVDTVAALVVQDLDA